MRHPQSTSSSTMQVEGRLKKNPPYIRILSVGSSFALFATTSPQPGHTMPSRLSCRIKHAKQNPRRQQGITLGVWADESYACSQRAQDDIVADFFDFV